MTLTQHQIELVQSTFIDVLDDHDPFHINFYDALFRRGPQLRALFRDDIEGQGMKFMAALKLIVASLDAPGALVAQYADLGRGHAIIGVRPEHFDVMGEALMETLAESLGEGFTAETEAAWRAAYGDLSKRIQAYAFGPVS
jgi:nitric oxide dioxygenase